MDSINEMPLIVIPDTHGHLAHVEAIIKWFRERGYLADHRLAFLGDYIDRGPRIRELIERCVQLQQEGHLFLMGNHEYTLIQALTPSNVQNKWIARWAQRYEAETLRSYGAFVAPRIFALSEWQRAARELRLRIPTAHWDFLMALPWVHETKDHVLVHAGLEPDVPWEEQRRKLLARITNNDRGPSQLFSTKLGYAVAHPASKILVTGHAVVYRPVCAPLRRMIHCGVEMGGPLVAWVSDQKKYIRVS